MRTWQTTIISILLVVSGLTISPAPSWAQLSATASDSAGLGIEGRVVALSAEEALAAMEIGVLSSEQYVEILLARIARYPEINAFITLDPDRALAAARAADAQRASGQAVGPLHGLPILLKANINTTDFPTSAGTPALIGNRPASNAPVAQRLIDAGAIVLGTTNMHELAAGITSNNAAFGPVRNPYDATRIAGGSSGGNGAALAARFAPVAIGTDTGGSVRIPAALTGTMGFRPSTGRYPLEGIVPLSTTLDTAGPMGRSVGDLALLDSVITGVPDDLSHVPVDGLRIGVPQAHFRDNLHPGTEAALQEVLVRLEEAGAVLVEEDLPGSPDPSVLAQQVIIAYEWPRDLSAYLSAEGTGLDFISLAPLIASPDVAQVVQFVIANPVSDALYSLFVLGVRASLQAGYSDYLETHQLDVVLFPTTPLPAAPIGQDFLVELNGELVPTLDTYSRSAHFTPLLGAPTLTLPVGLTDAGLPVGIDLAGAIGDDRHVLAIGQAISRHLPKTPPPAAIQPRPAGR